MFTEVNRPRELTQATEIASLSPRQTLSLLLVASGIIDFSAIFCDFMSPCAQVSFEEGAYDGEADENLYLYYGNSDAWRLWWSRGGSVGVTDSYYHGWLRDKWELNLFWGLYVYGLGIVEIIIVAILNW